MLIASLFFNLFIDGLYKVFIMSKDHIMFSILFVGIQLWKGINLFTDFEGQLSVPDTRLIRVKFIIEQITARLPEPPGLLPEPPG